MATRKRKAESQQIGLGLGPSLPVSASITSTVHLNPSQMPEVGARETERLGPTLTAEDLDELDDYDDDAMHDDVPRIRLADPPRASPRVIVEMVGESFEVSRLRNSGTTVASVTWTRSEIEELQLRIAAALEMR